MSVTPYFLITDILYFILLIGGILSSWIFRKSRFMQQIKATLFTAKGLAAFMIISCYFMIATLDSVHLYVNKPVMGFSRGDVISALDILLKDEATITEKTYSMPFASHQFTADSYQVTNKGTKWIYPTLKIHTDETNLALNLLYSILVSGLILAIIFLLLRKKIKNIYNFPTKTFCFMLGFIIFCITCTVLLQGYYHILGTDKVGNDVLYVSLKSVRTAILLGSITVLIMLPFAVFLGLAAGFWGGFIDDTIQFIYTTLSSIPSVLLIVAMVMVLQIYIERHGHLFATMMMRADVRLLLLCIILGITSWTNLCRVLRAETFKIRELEYVQAARMLGTSSVKILLRHILPNIMHIILITVILDFSLLVLAEAVLTYVGVGVDPTTFSWGNMIDAARMELARTPAVWWPIASAFTFMFLFILAINVYVDVLRDKLEPES